MSAMHSTDVWKPAATLALTENDFSTRKQAAVLRMTDATDGDPTHYLLAEMMRDDSEGLMAKRGLVETEWNRI